MVKPCAPVAWEGEMNTELAYLVASAALTFVLMLIAVMGATFAVGLPKLAGNREPEPEVGGWAGRAQRAHRNMLENLVLFAILVLVAHAAGISDGVTRLGAALYFWGRVAHAVMYVAGIPWLRTAAFGVSVVGLVMLFAALVK
jgi:uncharacterized MAPEG superfamily protein